MTYLLISISCRLLLLTSLVILSWSPIYADQPDEREQTIEDLFTERIYSCSEIGLNSSILIVRLYGEGKMDSVRLITDFWEQHCRAATALVRFKVLLDISANEYDGVKYGGIIIPSLLSYKRRTEFLKNETGTNSLSPNRLRYFRDGGLDSLSTMIAEQEKEARKHTREESWLLQYYSGTTSGMFPKLRDYDYRNFALGIAYEDFASSAEQISEDYLFLSGGGWFPHGNLRRLGNHPSGGLGVGSTIGEWLVQLEIYGRFGAAANSYVARLNGALDTTDHYQGALIGGQVGYRLLRERRNGLYVTFGLGFDRFFIDVAPDKGESAPAIDSFNGNVGFTYRRFLSKYSSAFFAIQTRYNVFNYDTDGGTNLSGNAFSVDFVLGLSGLQNGKWKNDLLKELGYYD